MVKLKECFECGSSEFARNETAEACIDLEKICYKIKDLGKNDRHESEIDDLLELISIIKKVVNSGHVTASPRDDVENFRGLI